MGGNFWGDLIKQLRAAQGISQRVLAQRAQVNRSTLRKIEAGRTVGDIATIERALDYLGYDLDACERDGKAARVSEMERDPAKRADLAAARVLSLRLV